jgi:hypothetical protein
MHPPLPFSSTGIPACANAAIRLDPKSLAHIATSFFAFSSTGPAGEAVMKTTAVHRCHTETHPILAFVQVRTK